jgi:drug/metabolite transporter (DMT)-like permease
MAVLMLLRASSRTGHDHTVVAIFARCVAALAMAGMSAFAKAAGKAGASPMEILFFRSALALPVVVIWVLLGPGLRALRPNRPRAHLSRALLGLTSMSIMFYALSLLSLADAITIFFIAPLIATCLSALLLGDKVGVHRWAAIGAGFLGVAIVMLPGSRHSALSLWGMSVAALGALLMAGVTITLRQLGQSEHEAATVFWFTVSGTVVMGCLYPFFFHPHGLSTWLLLVGVGCAGAVIQICTTTSLRLAPVSLTAPFDYTQLFWASLIGWLIWSDVPAISTIIGGCLIAGAGLYTLYRERLQRQAIMSMPPQ